MPQLQRADSPGEFPANFHCSSYCRPTSVSIGLNAVSVLQAGRPRALVRGSGGRALPDAVAALEALGPLAVVHPSALRLDADAVPLALRPLTAIVVAARPRVHSAENHHHRVYSQPVHIQAYGDVSHIRLSCFSCFRF